MYLISYTGYGGGGGGGGLYKHEASTVNFDDSMTINVDGGARGNGECPYGPSYCNDNPIYRAGFAGSDGKVFLVSRLYVPIHLTTSYGSQIPH